MTRRENEIFTLSAQVAAFAPAVSFPSVERQDSFVASVPYVLTGCHFSGAFLKNAGVLGMIAIIVGNGELRLSITPNSGVLAAFDCFKQAFVTMDDFITFSDGGILLPPGKRVSLYFGATTGGGSTIISTACLYLAPALTYGQ